MRTSEDVLYYSFCFILLRQGRSMNPESAISAKLVANNPQQFSHLSSHSDGVTKCMQQFLAYYVGAGIQTQDFLLGQQVL